MTFSHSGSSLNSWAPGAFWAAPTQSSDQVLPSPGPPRGGLSCAGSRTHHMPHGTRPGESRPGTAPEFRQSHGRSHRRLCRSHTRALGCNTHGFTWAPGLSHLHPGTHTPPQIALKPAATQVAQSQGKRAKTSPYTYVVSHTATKAYTHMHTCPRTRQPLPKLHYA